MPNREVLRLGVGHRVLARLIGLKETEIEKK